MGDPMTEEARLEALQRLLDYAVDESRELDLPQLEQLLHQARLVTEAELVRRATNARGSKALASAPARLALVAGTEARFKNGRASEA